MSIGEFLIDSCVVHARTVDTSGKTAKELFTAMPAVPCRLLKRAQTVVRSERTQHATDFRVTIMLRKGENVSPRDQISCKGRRYAVLDVIICEDLQGETHRNAVCEAVE